MGSRPPTAPVIWGLWFVVCGLWFVVCGLGFGRLGLGIRVVLDKQIYGG